MSGDVAQAVRRGLGERRPRLVLVAAAPGRGNKPQDTDGWLGRRAVEAAVGALLGADGGDLQHVRFVGADRDFRLVSVTDELRAGDFFGGDKVVEVRRHAPTKNAVKELKPLLDRTVWADGNVLVWWSQRSLPPSLHRAMIAADDVLFVDATAPRANEAPRAVAAMAGELGLRLERGAADLLVDRVGATLPILWTEMCKLRDYVGADAVVRPEDVDAACAETRDHDVFALVDAITARDRATTLRELERLMDQQIAPLRVVSLVAHQLRSLIALADVLRQGGDPADAPMAPWLARRMAPAARRLDPRRARRALTVLRQADQDLKTLRTPDRLTLCDHVLRLV